MLSGLEINIQYDNTSSPVFKEIEKGIYQSGKIKVSPGKTYNLIIKKLMGEEYRAKAVAPNLVIPNLQYKIEEYRTGFYDIYYEWKDPINQENYYWPTVAVNDTPEKLLYALSSDDGSNGHLMSINLSTKINKKDEVNIQLQCLDADSFKYYQQLLNSTFEDQLPFNPKNNFDKPVAGVFSIINYKPIILTIK
jgi:hypothetical protein